MYTYTDVKALDGYMLTRSYISGFQASKDDLMVYCAMATAPDAKATPNASRWYNHITALMKSLFPGVPEGVTVPGGAAAPAEPAAAGEGGKSKKEAKKDAKKDAKAAGGGGGGGGKPDEAQIAADKAKKLLKAVEKEGGKKGVEIEGAADMGGLEFFCTTMETPDGDVDLLVKSMEAMNHESDPTEEERRGGSGMVGKMIFSAGEQTLAMVAYVPKDKVGKIDASEWLKTVAKSVGGEVRPGATKENASAVAKANPDKGLFSIKMKDEAMASGFTFLKERNCFPEDDGEEDDDDYAFGDDAFDAYN